MTELDNKNINHHVGNIEDLIQLYLVAIDNQNKNEVETIYNENKKYTDENDIVFEIYNKDQLSNTRLKYIINNCSNYLNISSSLIKNLMKPSKKNINEYLLEIIFRSIKYFDNESIIDLLLCYKNKIQKSDSELNQQLGRYEFPFVINHIEFDNYGGAIYLFNVCEFGNLEMVKYLIKHVADITIKDKNKRTTLFYACKSGKEFLVKYLVKLGANINEEDEGGNTPLFNACLSGNENLVRYLVDEGADINKQNNDGETPLFNACGNGNVNLIKILIDLEVDKNKQDNDGKTLLLDAFKKGNENLIKYLVEHGTDVNK